MVNPCLKRTEVVPGIFSDICYQRIKMNDRCIDFLIKSIICCESSKIRIFFFKFINKNLDLSQHAINFGNFIISKGNYPINFLIILIDKSIKVGQNTIDAIEIDWISLFFSKMWFIFSSSAFRFWITSLIVLIWPSSSMSSSREPERSLIFLIATPICDIVSLNPTL